MAARHKSKKADGGKVLDAGGNPNVEREAEEKKHGGSVHAKVKKHSMHAEGGKTKKRLDKYRRGGRAMGGRTGADKHPLTSAAKVRHAGSSAGELSD